MGNLTNAFIILILPGRSLAGLAIDDEARDNGKIDEILPYENIVMHSSLSTMTVGARLFWQCTTHGFTKQRQLNKGNSPDSR
jgi:hypothetical protein